MFTKIKKAFILACIFGHTDSGVEAADVPLMRVKKISEDWNDTGNNTGEPEQQLAFNLTVTNLTISGFSSGGFQTANMLAIYNSKISGGAIVSGGGPCATRGACAEENAKNYSTADLKNKPVWVFGGSSDPIVPIDEQRATASWFVNENANVWMEAKDYWHTYANSLPNTTYNPDMSCNTVNQTMVNCQDDIAGRYLEHIIGSPLKPWNLNYNDNGQLYEFDQKMYISDINDANMNEFGYIYVPDACVGQECPLHIFFHGCAQSATYYGPLIMRKTGLLEHGSANNIVMLFLQNYDLNSQPYIHCWMSAAQSDKDFPQYKAISAIIKGIYGKDLLGEDDEGSYAVGLRVTAWAAVIGALVQLMMVV